jgi:hypothetical protein
MRRIALLAAALGAATVVPAGSAFAADSGGFKTYKSPVTYDHVEASFVAGDTENVDSIGVQAEGSVALTPDVRGWVSGLYTNGDEGPVDLDAWRVMLGGGYHVAVDPKVDVVVDAGIEFLHLDANVGPFGGGDSDTGIVLRGGARAVPVARVEVDGGLTARTAGDGGLGIFLGALYAASDTLSVGVSVSDDGDFELIALTARLRL